MLLIILLLFEVFKGFCSTSLLSEIILISNLFEVSWLKQLSIKFKYLVLNISSANSVGASNVNSFEFVSIGTVFLKNVSKLADATSPFISCNVFFHNETMSIFKPPTNY